MEEAWGVNYPVDDMGMAFQCFGDESSLASAEDGIRILREDLFLDVQVDIKGLNPYDPRTLRQSTLNLFTVDHLVTFVERKLAG